MTWIRVRFPNIRSILVTDEQKCTPIRSNGNSESMLLIHVNTIEPTTLSTRHQGRDSIDASLHKQFISNEHILGNDICTLKRNFRRSLIKHDENTVLNNDNTYYKLPGNLLEALIKGVTTTKATCTTTTNLRLTIPISSGSTRLKGSLAPMLAWNGPECRSRRL
jgi:hypothetical protein